MNKPERIIKGVALAGTTGFLHTFGTGGTFNASLQAFARAAVEQASAEVLAELPTFRSPQVHAPRQIQATDAEFEIIE